MIVAVNKIDKEDAEPERVKRELSEHDIVSEEWGGDTIFVNVSAKENTGIDSLLEMILLQSEMLELKANADKHARGHVIEARLDTGRVQYTGLMLPNGAFVDDMLVYRLGENRYLAVVNAANLDKDRDWFMDHTTGFGNYKVFAEGATCSTKYRITRLVAFDLATHGCPPACL